MRTWLLALMTVLVAFAGCFGDDGGDTATDTTSTSTTTAPVSTTTTSTSSTTTQTGEPEPDANTAPTASISASIEQGTIPFDVNFTLDGADADGDSLSWTFDADGDGAAETDGTELPAEYTFTYTSEGVFNATLTVDDGTNETVLVLEINATAAASGAGGSVGQTAAADWVAGTMAVGCFGDIFGVPYPEELDGIAYGSFEVDPATYGAQYSVEITTATEQDSPGFTFLDSGRSVIVSGFLGDVGTGKVPAGAATGVFWTCAGGAMHGEYTAG